MFHIYDITSCDVSCDHIHIALHCLTDKEKEKKKIKPRKIDKNKRKMFKSKYTIILSYFEGPSQDSQILQLTYANHLYRVVDVL